MAIIVPSSRNKSSSETCIAYNREHSGVSGFCKNRVSRIESNLESIKSSMETPSSILCCVVQQHKSEANSTKARFISDSENALLTHVEIETPKMAAKIGCCERKNWLRNRPKNGQRFG